MRTAISFVALISLLIPGLAAAQSSDPQLEEIQALRDTIRQLEQRLDQLEAQAVESVEEQKDLEKRVMKTERKSALDRINFTGDFRFEAHSIDATIPDHYNGMALQRMLVDTLFYVGATGMPPASPEDVAGLIQSNYSDYQYYLNNLTFDQLKQMMGMFPPEMQEQLMGSLLPYTHTPGYDVDNGIIYTNRLRLAMHADVAKDVTFDGRLSMYKAWGDSTGVQVFNGQPTSINVDGTTASVPNSDLLRVERAYFTWKNIGGLPMYLSIGRRPSTGGAPLNFRNDEPRGGTPLGSVINYQFDGATLGYHLGEHSTLRLCYGVGYESGFGSAQELQQPQDRLDDASFLGINWDVWSSDDMFVQATLARAMDVTDGFNGLVVMPVDPVSGQPSPGPAIIRYTPSANLGDIDWASLVFIRHDGPFDYFGSINYMQSDPNPITTPFGGLFADPFDSPVEQDGYMYYLGVRYNLPNGKTKLGLEYNHGSEYWFNMAVAEDDLFAPKTSARGDVWELYLTHRIAKRFIFKFDYMRYDYDYSGSGWHLGAPKELDSTPILGFPTYSEANKFTLSLLAQF